MLDYRGVGGGSGDPQGHKAHGDEEAVPDTTGHLPRGGEHLQPQGEAVQEEDAAGDAKAGIR